MDHGMRNGQRVHERRPASPGRLIHEHVRHAIEVVVEEELAAGQPGAGPPCASPPQAVAEAP